MLMGDFYNKGITSSHKDERNPYPTNIINGSL